MSDAFNCSMKTNVTLRLEQVLIREVQILAAEQNVPTADPLTTVFEQIVQDETRTAREHR